MFDQPHLKKRPRLSLLALMLLNHLVASATALLPKRLIKLLDTLTPQEGLDLKKRLDRMVKRVHPHLNKKLKNHPTKSAKKAKPAPRLTLLQLPISCDTPSLRKLLNLEMQGDNPHAETGLRQVLLLNAMNVYLRDIVDLPFGAYVEWRRKAVDPDSADEVVNFLTRYSPSNKLPFYAWNLQRANAFAPNSPTSDFVPRMRPHP